MAFNLKTFINTNPSTFSDSDTIHLWLSQSTNPTASFILALAVPNVSQTNGNIESILLEAERVVFKFWNATDFTSSSTDYLDVYNVKIENKKRLPTHFYLGLEEVIRVPTSSVIPGEFSQYLDIGFEPSNTDIFKNSGYDVIGENVIENRRSKKVLSVDRTSFGSIQSGRIGVLPVNFTVLSSSLQEDVRSSFDEILFANVQDSLYYDRGWSNGRYSGTKITNKTVGAGISGSEPALPFTLLDAVVNPLEAETAAIKALFTDTSRDIQRQIIYYNTIGVGQKDLFGNNITTDYNTAKLAALPYNSLQFSLSKVDPTKRSVPGNIVNFTPTSSAATYMYTYNEPERRYTKLSSRKVYSVETDQVFTVDEEGKIILIE